MPSWRSAIPGCAFPGRSRPSADAPLAPVFRQVQPAWDPRVLPEVLEGSMDAISGLWLLSVAEKPATQVGSDPVLDPYTGIEKQSTRRGCKICKIMPLTP